MKRFFALLVICCMMLSLTACAAPFGNGEALLAAPKLSIEQQQITQTLRQYMKEEIQLKYPRRGENLSPFILIDMNQDGVKEAIALFTTKSTGKNVQLALLVQKDEEWHVSCRIEGDNTDVDSVTLASVFQDGCIQLILGYTSVNFADKALAVYFYQEGTLQKAYSQSYDDYKTEDLNGDGYPDIAAVSADGQPGSLRLTLLFGDTQGLQEPVSTQLYTQFTSCINFHIGKNDAGEKLLVIDGYTSGNHLATEILKYTNDTYTRYAVMDGVPAQEMTVRTEETLLSMDVDKDGCTEVPTVAGRIETVPENSPFCFVDWYGFKERKTYAKLFTVVNGKKNYAVVLPPSWRLEVRLEEVRPEQEWRLVRLEDEKSLCYLKEVPLADMSEQALVGGYRQLGISGGYVILIKSTDYMDSVDYNEYFKGIQHLS